MGTVYTASCQCGYQKGDLMSGYGMARQGYAIVACHQCNRLSSIYLGDVSTLEEPDVTGGSCRHCRKHQLEIYHLKETGNRCLQCGNCSLEMNVSLLWD